MSDAAMRDAATMMPGGIAGKQPSRPNLVAFGSRQLHQMTAELAARGLANDLRHGVLSLTTTEALQLVRLYRRDLFVPAEFRRYIISQPDLPVIAAGALDCIDGIFLELCGMEEIRLHGWQLNRRLVEELLLDPVRALSPEAAHLVADWFRNGLLGGRDDVRRDSAAALLRIMPRGDADTAIQRDIIRHAHCTRLDDGAIRDSLSALRATLGAPLCVLSHALRYLPDGRPLYWPPDHITRLRAICDDLAIQLVEPRQMPPDAAGSAAPFIAATAERLFAAWNRAPSRRN